MKQGLLFFVLVIVCHLVQATRDFPPQATKMGVSVNQKPRNPKPAQSYQQDCKEIYDCCCCACKDCIVPCLSYTCRECAVPCVQETGRLCCLYKRPIAIYVAVACTCSAIDTFLYQVHNQSNSML